MSMTMKSECTPWREFSARLKKFLGRGLFPIRRGKNGVRRVCGDRGRDPSGDILRSYPAARSGPMMVFGSVNDPCTVFFECRPFGVYFPHGKP